MRRLPGSGAWIRTARRSSSPTLRSSLPRRLQTPSSKRQEAARNPRLALRLLRATSRLGAPGALAGPPELLPLGARVFAQGYLNRFSLLLLNGWLLPPWMREQTDPSSPTFVPRSVHNLMINQTRRNWTALGIPGAGHPVESIVDTHGLLTPIPGGPSLDWWVQIEAAGARHTAPTIVAPSQMEVAQRLQADLPVVVSAYEMSGLRVSSEAWMLPLEESDWAAMQVVLFNIADMPLKGTFIFALRPYNGEGISPIYNISYDGSTLRADGHPGPTTWPRPEGYLLSNLRSGDLFNTATHLLQSKSQSPKSKIEDPRGFAHGLLHYSFHIEPWEEAEFLAFMPVHTRQPNQHPHPKPLFTTPTAMASARSKIQNRGALWATKIEDPDPQMYSRAKAATTLAWRSLLDTGMRLSLPHRDLQASWEASRAHVLALHDGPTITPGPDTYHNFWLRDATYMVHALSITGYAEEAAQLLRGFVAWQRRNGAFVSHRGEWDSTGQALWAMGQHLLLHPDPALDAQLRPAIEKGSAWIAHMLARSPDGLMPPGISSEHLGPPDRYYWDNLWSLAGLKAAERLLGRGVASRTAHKLRRTLSRAWQEDAATLGRQAIPAAPGRGIDLGMIGSLAAWFPLELLPIASPLMQGTLDTLEESLFHQGALFVGTGHSGWGTYLNMRIAGCYLLQGSQRGWGLMRWLLCQASPTYNWPEAIHPHSLGGSAGDGHHGWASAEWLMLVRAMLVHESARRLVITPALPQDWLAQSGHIALENAPTRFGPLNFRLEWDGKGTARLQLNTTWRTPPGSIVWKLPHKIHSAHADGKATACGTDYLSMPLNSRTAEAHLTTEPGEE